MDDLEKAICQQAVAFCQQLNSQVVAFCQQIKDNSLILLGTRYSDMTPDQISFLRKSLFSMACFEGLEDKNSVRLLDGPAYTKNKLAQVLTTLIYFEYPAVWSCVFLDFLPNLSRGVVVIDMSCRLLNSLDDGLISLDNPRTTEETAVAARVKHL
ncbi:Exportin-T [Heracleum sosnowskyi]|uniref:Exportin-T n=1 Tax=Heracleum sosnowskyi TaxID=360622 RepID=A0AAD8IL57_9APIA|nr:Exportin-T [Heracleum sosnowskyi]